MLFLLLSTFKHKEWLRILFFATQKAKFALEARKSRFFDPRTRCHSNSEFSASFPTDSQQNLRLHVYEGRPRKDHRGVDLISDALPFGRFWHGEANATSNAVDCVKFYSRFSRTLAVYINTGRGKSP
ncbi:MAG: hypothetical protein Udaeo2_25950 [Candidatus Udaeobacter sp.]|jgi:hypothetical protein|nr:MAG: hypothetical protein Udaeo2_25950 [Candidatus Udaeobacter sp.]